jgi:hypothetical protein
MDEKNGVLGPVSWDVLKDLAQNGKLTGFSKISINGTTWQNISEISEIAQIMLPPGLAARRAQDERRAERVLVELERFRSIPTHELFGVPKDSPVKVYRQGYVNLAKPIHPGRLPNDTHPSLLRACMQMFQFLSERMAQIEKSSVKERT